MSYKVLYRKYRPINFREVIGQKNIVQILKSSIENNKTSHAYIFTGVRGTGKTSVAKIFAKTINCLDQHSGESCEKCANCLNFDNSPDIIEIDAASNNGVDQKREIIGNSRLVPSTMSYKIYIIDEVHMLSPSAYNALLKTLEEPVDHVKFILATTEVQKVPMTILSRCQRFDFTRIATGDICDYLQLIIEKEKIKCDIEALKEIALLSEGSLRDALSILDQLSNNKNKISMKDVEMTFRSITTDSIEKMVLLIDKHDIKGFIELYKEFKNKGSDVGIIILKLINNYKEKIYSSINNNTSKIGYYKKVIMTLLECQRLIKMTSNADMVFEINMLNFILENDSENSEKSSEIINNPEKIVLDPAKKDKNYDQIILREEPKISKNIVSDDLKKIRINNCFVDADKKTKVELEEKWENFKKVIEDKDLALFSMIENSKLEVASPKYLLISVTNSSTIRLIDAEIDEIEKQFNKYAENKHKICFLSNGDWKKEKDQYIKNKKDNMQYKLIDEPTLKNNKNKALETAVDLFGEESIDVR